MNVKEFKDYLEQNWEKVKNSPRTERVIEDAEETEVLVLLPAICVGEKDCTIPYRIVAVGKREEGEIKVEHVGVISSEYELITHKDAIREVENSLIERGYKTKVVFAKDVGADLRALVVSNKLINGNKRVAVLIENSYKASSALKHYLYLVEKDEDKTTLIPVVPLWRRKHVKGSWTKEEWETVEKLIAELPHLFERMGKIRVKLSKSAFESLLKGLKTTYYRKKDEGKYEKVVFPIGEEIYKEMVGDLGDTPTIYEAYIYLCEKIGEKRQGLTLQAKRKLEKGLLRLMQTIRKRLNAGIIPQVIEL